MADNTDLEALRKRISNINSRRDYLQQVLSGKIAERDKRAEELKSKGVDVDNIDRTEEKLTAKVLSLTDELLVKVDDLEQHIEQVYKKLV